MEQPDTEKNSEPEIPPVSPDWQKHKGKKMKSYNPDPKLSVEEAVKDVIKVAQKEQQSLYTSIKGLLIIVTPDSTYDQIMHKYKKSYVSQFLTVEKLYKKYGE